MEKDCSIIILVKNPEACDFALDRSYLLELTSGQEQALHAGREKDELCFAPKYNLAQVVRVRRREVQGRQGTASASRHFYEFDERDFARVFRLKADLREGQVVAPTITFVRGKQKGVVDACAAPESRPVFVIAEKRRKGVAGFNVGSVVRVETDEDEAAFLRYRSLVGLASEELSESETGMQVVHESWCDA